MHDSRIGITGKMGGGETSIFEDVCLMGSVARQKHKFASLFAIIMPFIYLY